MDRLEVGKIINTHGLRGEVKIATWTDFPEDFEDIKNVYTKDEMLTITSLKYQKNNIIVKFKGIDTIEQAELYKNKIIEADREDLPPLPEGMHYIVDMLGSTIQTIDGEVIGKLADIFSAGAGNVYTIKRQGKKDLLLPAQDEFVKNVDIENKLITVIIPDGLED